MRIWGASHLFLACLQEPPDFRPASLVPSAVPSAVPADGQRALGEVSDTGQMDLLRLLATQELSSARF